MFSFNETMIVLLSVFVIVLLGYIVGCIRIRGIGLGTAAIFFIGLVFGHLGLELPEVLQSMGLVLFITAVGFSAGPGFLIRIRKNGLAYMLLCLITASTGACLCAAIIHIGKVETPLAIGILTGAFTTSPGFAAAKEAMASEASVVAAGYGMTYPVGVVCKVLFIQLVPKLLHADMAHERALIRVSPPKEEERERKHLMRMDAFGIFPFALAIIVGLALGAITLPLPGGHIFSLGMTGGPLIASLLISCRGRLGHIDTRCAEQFIGPTKELGLLLFYSGAGVQGGHGIAEIFYNHSIMPIIYGFLLVAIPLLIGFCTFHFLLRLPLLNGLSSMTASMTCTPSLAVLTQISGTNDVAAAYATTYPLALVMLVLVVQFLSVL